MVRSSASALYTGVRAGGNGTFVGTLSLGVGYGVVLCLVLCLVVGLVLGLAGGAGTAAGMASTDVARSGPQDTIAGTGIDADDTLLRVTLHPDGSATWRVEYRIRINDDNESEAFSQLKSDIESNPESYRKPFAEDMRATAASAENQTGRKMAIRNVTVSATRKQLPQEYGVVIYRFEWTAFARVTDEGSTIRAGDALQGLFLDDETSLMFVWPETYQLVSVAPNTNETRPSAVVWTGPMEFADGQPRVVVSKEGAGPPGGNGGNGGVRDPLSTLFSSEAVVGVLLVAGAVGLGIWLYSRHRQTTGAGASGAPGDRGAAGESGAAGAGGAAGADDAGADDAGTPAHELLSNEERVLALLEERDGRIKQQEVAAELGWTDAKTSQVVKGMREDDRVEVFRLGRENVLSLPDDGPGHR